MMEINAWKQTNEGTRAGTVPQNTKKKTLADKQH